MHNENLGIFPTLPTLPTFLILLIPWDHNSLVTINPSSQEVVGSNYAYQLKMDCIWSGNYFNHCNLVVLWLGLGFCFGLSSQGEVRGQPLFGLSLLLLFLNQITTTQAPVVCVVMATNSPSTRPISYQSDVGLLHGSLVRVECCKVMLT